MEFIVIGNSNAGMFNFFSFQRSKAPHEETIPLLMPQHHMVIPHYMGRSRDVEIQRKDGEDNPEGMKRQDSFSSRSSFQDIPLLLPQDSGGLDGSHEGPKSNGMDINTTKSVSFKIEPVTIDTPMKGFVDDSNSSQPPLKPSVDVSTQKRDKTSDPEWWETQERGDQCGSMDERGQVGPRTSCHCQVCCIGCDI